MAEQFAPPPINPVISIRPVSTPPPGQDATNVQTVLAALPPGTVLEGFVVNRDVQNNPILRTPQGDLQIQSDVFVKTGSQMVIRVDATSESRARIVTIDGLEPQLYAAQASRGITQDTIVPSQMMAQPSANLQPGAVQPQQPSLQAVLLGTVPAGVPAGRALPAMMPDAVMIAPALLKLQAGAALKVNLLELKLPTELIAAKPGTKQALPQTASLSQPGQPIAANPMQQGAPLRSQTPIEQAAMASPQAARIAMQTSPQQPATLPPQAPVLTTPPPITQQASAQLPHQIAAYQAVPPVATPPATAAQMQPAPATRTPPTTFLPNTLPGVVIGHEPDGGNVVHTQIGMLKIFTPSPLPMQSHVTLQVEPENKPAPLPTNPTIPGSTETGEESLSALSRGWSKLDEAVDALGWQTQAGRELAAAMPQVSHKLASGLLFFMAAVKGGDLNQWLGRRAVADLESKLPEIAARLKGDMAQMQQLFLHSPLDHWSGMLIPMLHQGAIEYAKFYIRDENPENQGQGGGKDQRFIVELELSHLGDMQFDGFVRQGAAKKQFDLIIRSARPLPPEISGDIRTIFDQSMGATGYAGYLAFQQGSQHFVRPLAQEKPDGDHTILA